jgi:hypothetical protein
MNLLKNFLLAACLLTVTSCATTRVDEWVAKLNLITPRAASKESTQYRRPTDIALPIKRNLIVYLSPRDLVRQTRIPETNEHPEYWLEEGKLVQGAAIKAFARLFERVSPGKEQVTSYPVATVRASSSFNPVLGMHSARVIVGFTSENGVPIVELEAKSSANGYGEAAFAKALDAAFQDITAQFLKSETLVAAFADGPNPPGVVRETLSKPSPVMPLPTPTEPMAEEPALVKSVPSEAMALRKQKDELAKSAGPPANGRPPQDAAPASAPYTPTQPAKPGVIQVPISGNLGIYIAPDTLSRQTYVSGGYSSYWFKEGSLIESAATKTFGRLFERVSSVEESGVRYPMVKVEGVSSYNPTVGTYFATVFADFFPRNGDPVATITAKSSAAGEGEAGFETAYNAAFRDVEKQFLQDRALVATLAEAASQAKSTISPLNAAGSSKAPSASIPIPNDGSLIVYMAPEELQKQTIVAAGFGYASYWFEEGKTIQRAAIETFGKIFGRVSAGAGGADSATVVTVHGSGTFNPLMKTYSGRVVAIFSSPNGPRLGRFEARATVDEHGEGDAGFEKAYDAAFQDIVDQLVKAGHL